MKRASRSRREQETKSAATGTAATGTASRGSFASYQSEPLGVPLRKFLGKCLRRERERRGLRQDHLAALAHRWGFTSWTQATVARIEAGRRPLSVEEFLMLGWITANIGPDSAMRGDGAPMRLHDLFPTSLGEMIGLNRRLMIDASSLEDMLSGRAHGNALVFQMAPSGVRAGDNFMDQWHAGIAERELIRPFWPTGTLRPDGRVTEEGVRFIEAVDADKLAEAEQKAARRLRTVPVVVAATARNLWGRSFTEERDRRVADGAPPDAGPRTLQALRGHVTRALLEELRQAGIEGLKGLKAKRPTRTRKPRA